MDTVQFGIVRRFCREPGEFDLTLGGGQTARFIRGATKGRLASEYSGRVTFAGEVGCRPATLDLAAGTLSVQQ